jgi:hypothetical protein
MNSEFTRHLEITQNFRVYVLVYFVYYHFL